MELDIKPTGNENLKELISSLELVSARVFDTITTASQTADSNTPEIRLLFQQWLSLIGGEIIETLQKDGKLDPAKTAEQIGITPSSVISLALALHRQGKIKITGITAEEGDGRNQEICGCLN